MQRRLLGFLLSCLLSFLFWLSLFLPAIAAAQEKASFWEVRGAHAVAYLFGSLHVCKADCYPLNKAIVERFDASPMLMVELDPNTPDAQKQLMKAAMQPHGRKLSTTLPTATKQMLDKAMKTLALPPDMLEPFHPWMAAVIMTTHAAEQQGYTVRYGIDQWFLQRAATLAKPVFELETIERQIHALTNGSDQEQIAALHLTAAQIAEGQIADQLRALVSAWREGDLVRLESLTQESFPRESTLMQALITARNQEMSKRIDAQLARGQSAFVTVGAAHMTGKEGLPALLARRGYTVRAIQNDK